ncbi:DNA gyrase subunit A, partial [Streptococcus suis]
YNFNMVEIHNFTPRQVGLNNILSSYIANPRYIIIARTNFDKEKAQKRLHIEEAKNRVITNMDQVNAHIRSTQKKEDDKKNY